MIAFNHTQSPLGREHPLFAVQAALAQGARQEAARLFLDKAAHLVVPPGRELLAWVVQCLGRTAAGRLIEALASHPCFYCKGGYTACEDCAGHGVIDGREVCSSCLGTGLCPCDFCNASGQATIDVVPKDLRLATVTVRVRQAMAQAEQLLPEPFAADSPDAWRAGARLLLKLNRLEGIAENGAIATIEYIPSRLGNEHPLGQIMRACGRLAGRLNERIKHILVVLSADSSPRGAFYRSLGEGRSAGSWLEHPAIRRLHGAADGGPARR